MDDLSYIYRNRRDQLDVGASPFAQEIRVLAIGGHCDAEKLSFSISR
jgi:hypothetical protein